MKNEFEHRLRRDVDVIWKGGMGAMLILLLLCMEILAVNPNRGMTLLLCYGLSCMGIFAALYLVIARRVGGTLYKLGGLIENLTNGNEEEIFPTAEDTILSRLQTQVMRLYDIRRSYEEREQVMRRQLDENIGDLVHQINTPITNIKLYAGFLKRSDLTGTERERFLNCLEEQAQKLSWLGESFSKVSRLETGIIRLKLQLQPLEPVILRAVGQITEKAQLHGMDIVLVGETQTEVTADTKWTTEALFNVLDNAVKYGEQGSRIEIEVRRLTHYAKVSVRNSGVAIDSGEYHSLFERFYRGKGSGAQEGSGLGLYIARKILEEEKGYITAGRAPGGKTEFSLYLDAGRNA